MSRPTRIIPLLFGFLFNVSGENLILLTKCCPDNFHVNNTCVVNTIANKKFTDVPLYNLRTETIYPVKNKFDSIFRVITNASISPQKEITNAQLFLFGNIITDNDFIEPSSFCLDYKENGNSTEIGFWLVGNESQQQRNPPKNLEQSYLSIISLLTSCVFFSLTIIVYILLPDLRRLKGKIIMSCVISLLSAFLGLATMHIVELSSVTVSVSFCYSFTSIFYFFILSSFCWINALAFMMWRDNRRIFNRTPRDREAENKRFKKYFAYAWGVPMTLTILLNVLDHIDEESISLFMKPNIIKNGCFLRGYERLVYLDVPLLILLISNWYFFTITAYNIWGTFKSSKILNDSALSLKKLLLVYVKLSVMMGISWVLEIVAHFLTPSHWNPFWLMVDLYNGFIGVAFFIVLVCKKHIWKSLKLRWQEKDANINSYTTGSRLQSVSVKSN